MQIELWLIDREHTSTKQKIEVDLPLVPRVGEVIIIGETQNYEIDVVVYRFDSELRFTGRITVDALSLWNKKQTRNTP